MAPRFDMIGIVTCDLPRSLAFYRELGLDIPAEADTEPHVEVTLTGGLRLAWDPVETIRSFDPDYEVGPGHGIGLAFLCDSPDEVNATFERLTALGHRAHKPPWDAFWGQRYAQLLDPDGNSVELFAPLA